MKDFNLPENATQSFTSKTYFSYPEIFTNFPIVTANFIFDLSISILIILSLTILIDNFLIRKFTFKYFLFSMP